MSLMTSCAYLSTICSKPCTRRRVIGLAATQVNVHKRVLVTDVSVEKDEPFVLINPLNLEKDGVTVTDEGCLSVPGYYEEVERAEHIKVRFLDRQGDDVELEAHGLLAVCIQHEMDHLDGKLFVDYLSEQSAHVFARNSKKSAVNSPRLSPRSLSLSAPRIVFAGTPSSRLFRCQRLLTLDIMLLLSTPNRTGRRVAASD